MVEPVFAQQEQPARGALLRAAGMDLGRPPDVLPKARRRRYPIPAEPVRGRRRSGAAGTWRERAAELAVTADGNRAKQIMQRQAFHYQEVAARIRAVMRRRRPAEILRRRCRRRTWRS